MILNRPLLEAALRSTLPDLDNAQCTQEPTLFPDLTSWKIHLYEVVDSTNAVVWKWLQHDRTTGVAVIAQQQQAGRGQRGRQWRSAPGGLYLSLGLPLQVPVGQAGLLTLSAAWGITSVLQASGVPVQIKWPNDLVVNRQNLNPSFPNHPSTVVDPLAFTSLDEGRGDHALTKQYGKLGGILTETRIQAGYIHQAVVGVGMNWSNPVPEEGINLKTIAATSPISIASLEELAAQVLQGLRTGYLYWQQHGSTALIACYEQHLIHIGETIALPVGMGAATGTILGVTIAGHLRVGVESSDTAIVLGPGMVRLGYATS